ncbi:PREDICTED: P protein-like isoform X2 [Priapulus caudatus]|uniref:P protein-like isoform X2 n=1 Tax=Priapulus caudatus TaxID=37621 RepID=A0ABM1EJA4_PRICU|nr:PREDICTED: P protein-like isoform X2 [Priapulus caudatus]
MLLHYQPHAYNFDNTIDAVMESMNASGDAFLAMDRSDEELPEASEDVVAVTTDARRGAEPESSLYAAVKDPQVADDPETSFTSGNRSSIGKRKDLPAIKMTDYGSTGDLMGDDESGDTKKAERRVGIVDNALDEAPSSLSVPVIDRQDTIFYIKESHRQRVESESKQDETLLSAPSEKTPLLGGMKTERSNSWSSEASDVWARGWTDFWTCCTCRLPEKWHEYLVNIKVIVLSVAVLLVCLLFTLAPVSDMHWSQFAVSKDYDTSINLTWDALTSVLQVELKGPMVSEAEDIDSLANTVTLNVLRLMKDGSTQNASSFWTLALKNEEDIAGSLSLQTDAKHFFDINITEDSDSVAIYQLKIQSTSDYLATLLVSYANVAGSPDSQVVYAAIILVLMYVLIIFELVHRTVAAMLGALAAMAVLAYLRERPTLDMVMTWLDFETLGLLFGMMVIVGIFMETGFFDYVAVQAYKRAKGQVWPLITTLLLVAGVFSAFMDNVTTILLLVPVTIRLCETLNLDPKHVLIAEVIFSNIAGSATAIGDPPNVIIVSNSEFSRKGINFNTFTLHMTIGVVIVALVSYCHLRFMYRRRRYLQFKDPPEVQEIKHEKDIWRRTRNSLMYGTREAERIRVVLSWKMEDLENRLAITKEELEKSTRIEEDFQSKLHHLEQEYKVKDKSLLIKTSSVLVIVILLFFLEPLEALHLSLGWIAIMGAIVLMIVSDRMEIESVINRVEWTTLIFFAALFVLMKGMEKLGLLAYIGTVTADIISSVEGENRRLLVAIVLITWVSAFASSFIDNIPFTTAMVSVVTQLAEDPKVGVPLGPMVWSLAFGACLGGNGTLIGASCNVVCAGLSEQHGYKLTFMEFFKVGFPMMIVSVTVAMLYLIICHVVIGWNGPYV